MGHEYGEHNEVQRCQHLRQALEVARETAKTCWPGNAALNLPASRQQLEALLRLGQLDQAQLDAGRRRVLLGLLTRVALVGPGDLDRFSSDSLHGFAQLLAQCVPVRIHQGPRRWTAPWSLALTDFLA